MAEGTENGGGRHAGHAVRDARLRKGLSQAEFARRLGLYQSDVSAIESGRQRVGPIRAKRIARLMRVRDWTRFCSAWIETRGDKSTVDRI
jgi:transcriptional regulator with XRE-family HTH domain